jgi:preprotein translocase subunit SecG
MVIQVCLCEVENKTMIVMIVVFIFNKIIVAFVTKKGDELAEKIEKENTYSNELVLTGLNEKQRQELAKLLQQVEDNASENWHFVKNGGKREY